MTGTETKPGPIKGLHCCCCGQWTLGRQWWNRDKGYGVCVVCIERVYKNESPEALELMFGKRGVHYCVKRNEE